MPKIDPEASAIPEVPRAQRIAMALDAYLNSAEDSKPSIRRLARQHGIDESTIRGRLAGAKSRQEEDISRRFLSSEEESCLAQWALQLERWGWPPRVSQLRFMGTSMIRERDPNFVELGVNWPQKFFKRNPTVTTRWARPMDNQRIVAQDPDTIAEYFELYRKTREDHNFEDRNVYNMDEKGAALGVQARCKVVCSKHNMAKTISQSGNREWVSMIECISLDGRILNPWIIFKGKMQKKTWREALGQGHIALSENGWTDNELGLEWLKQCFEPQTRTEDNKRRLLIFDGHQSHITSEAIKFCVTNGITLLCLPPHATHILQPLDVGYFGPFSQRYKKELEDFTRLGAGYQIDKTDFINLYKIARTYAASKEIIQSSWRKSGLFPFNPELVLAALPANQAPKEPTEAATSGIETPKPKTSQARTPQSNTATASNPQTPSLQPDAVEVSHIHISLTRTPANSQQVEALLEALIKLQSSEGNPCTKPALLKIAKYSKKSAADLFLQRTTNQTLMVAQERKARRKNRAKGNYGQARIMDLAAVEERDTERAAKEEVKETARQVKQLQEQETQFRNIYISEIGRLGPHLFEVAGHLQGRIDNPRNWTSGSPTKRLPRLQQRPEQTANETVNAGKRPAEQAAEEAAKQAAEQAKEQAAKQAEEQLAKNAAKVKGTTRRRDQETTKQKKK